MNGKLVWKVSAAALAALMALGTAACGSSGGGSAGGDGKVTLQWWVADPDSWCDGYKQIVTDYQAANPDVTIKFATYPDGIGEKLKAAQAANKEPDIYGEVIPVVGNERFLELDPYMEKDGFNADEIYYQPYFDYWCKFEGKTYGLPRDIFATVMCYNKKLFDEAGVEYPKEGWTVDEFVETCKKLTNPEKKQYGVVFTDDFYSYFPMFWLFGADQLADDGSVAEGYVNSEAMIGFMTFLQDLVYKDAVAPTSKQMNVFGEQDKAGGGTANIFQMGHVAMIPIERYAVGDYQGANMDIGVVSFPVNDKGEQWVYGSMPTWSISKATKNPDEAWNFLKYAFGPEGSETLAKTGYFFPAVTSVDEKLGIADDPIDSVFMAQFNQDNPTKMPFLWRRPENWEGVYSPDLDGPWGSAYDSIMVSQKDVTESLNKAAAEMDKNIATFKKQKGVAE